MRIVAMIFAKIGSCLYVIWGLLHVEAAYEAFSQGASLNSGIVQGKIYQDAWSLLFFALFSIAIGIKYDWKNSVLGYWLNLVVVSAADIGFLIFILFPGYVAFVPGILGPVFWISAAIFSSIGIKIEKTS